MKLVAVIGSVTPPGRLSRALSEAMARAANRGHSTDVIDLGSVHVGYADGRALEEREDDAQTVVARTCAGDAVLLSTPVYRASFTGALKNLLDLLPLESLSGKPCGVVAMGASLHHYLGVDGHMRDVLAWFGALTAPTSVYLSNADFSNGEPTERAAGELDALIETLATLSELSRGREVPLGPVPLAQMAKPA
jgi:FMN reductase